MPFNSLPTFTSSTPRGAGDPFPGHVVLNDIVNEVEALRGNGLLLHAYSNTASGIQQAIDEANTAGGGVVLVSGDVEVTDWLRIKSNVTLMGNPYKRARFRFADAYQPSVTGKMFGVSGSGQSNIRISGLTVLHNLTWMTWANTQTDGWQGISQLFRLESATGVIIDHNDISNTAVRYAIYLQSCSGHIHIHHNDVTTGVHNVTGAEQMDGIHLMNPNCTAADPGIIEWNRVHSGQFGGDDGIVIRNVNGGGATQNIRIQNNDVYACGQTAIRLVAHMDTTTTNLVIVGNRIHSSARGGIHLSRVTGGTVDPIWTVTIDRNSIHGWGLTDATTGSIYLYSSTGVTLGNNPVMVQASETNIGGPKSLVFNSPATAVTFTNIAAAITEIPAGAGARNRADLSNTTQIRVVAGVTTASAAGAVLAVQYSLDNGSTWVFSDGGSSYTSGVSAAASLAATGTIGGTWRTVPTAMKTDVVLRLVTVNGDGAADPVVGRMDVQVR